MMSAHKDKAAHGRQIVDFAEEQGVAARLVGGAGIWLTLDPELRSAYESVRPAPHDVDVLVPRGQGKAIGSIMSELGFTGDERLNALRGDTRQCWYLLDQNNEPEVDVDIFIGRPPLCHDIDFSERLGNEGPSMTATDLLLQKIQIVEINDKDVVDAAYLILDRGVSEGGDDGRAISVPRIADLLSHDWGFFHTATSNLDRIATSASDFLDSDRSAAVSKGSQAIAAAAIEAPKSFKWRMRAKIGTKSQWYDDVEEVER